MAGCLTNVQAERIFAICAVKVEQSQLSASDAREVLTEVARKINEDTLPRTMYLSKNGFDLYEHRLPNDVIRSQDRGASDPVDEHI